MYHHLRSIARQSSRIVEAAATSIHRRKTEKSLLWLPALTVGLREAVAVNVHYYYSTTRSHCSCCHPQFSRPSKTYPVPTTTRIATTRIPDNITLRYLSSSSSSSQPEQKHYDKIHVLYASQTGTAQLFAMQLTAAIEDHSPNTPVDCLALSEVNPVEYFAYNNNKNHLFLFLVSTTGVGEFPDNGREFYKQLLAANDVMLNGDFSMFALGNSAAHPHHFCAAAKVLDETLHHRGRAILPTELGDDGDEDRFLEDVFDQWQERIVQIVVTGELPVPAQGEIVEKEQEQQEFLREVKKEPTLEDVEEFEHRKAIYPQLRVKAPQTESAAAAAAVRTDLLDVCPDFYVQGCQRMTVLQHESLNPDPSTVAGLREICFALPEGTTYETGDHLLVYPRNPDILVEAFLALLEEDDDGNTLKSDMIIQGPGPTDPSAGSKARKANYPHPTGISIYETLSHCVDLEAIPSPSFARWITGKGRDLDFKNEIAIPRRTVLDLLLDHQPPSKISLQDLLYHLPALQPRYYSIASSSHVHPDRVYLTYRPIHYLSTRGEVRNGLCTSYLQRIPSKNAESSTTQIVAAVRSNPLFRLPTDPVVPIVLIAGGCGVAPIRAFLEELVDQQRKQQRQSHPKNVHLFLGFRNPNDQVYRELVEQASDILETCRITFNTGCPDPSQCGLISDALRQEASKLLPMLLENGETAPHFYVCGGARAFGVAVERAFYDILLTTLETEEKTTERLRELLDQGRLHEDLSD